MTKRCTPWTRRQVWIAFDITVGQDATHVTHKKADFPPKDIDFPRRSSGYGTQTEGATLLACGCAILRWRPQMTVEDALPSTMPRKWG